MRSKLWDDLAIDRVGGFHMENQVVTSRTRVLKGILSALEKLPDLRVAQVVVFLPQLRLWRKTKASDSILAPSRRALHESIAREVANEKILYLEFGVYKGDSIKYWLHLNKNCHSRFVGFDTFTGLPEVWQRNFAMVARNTFDAGGTIPVVEDDRCNFEVGLFQHTLRPFVNSLERTKYDRVVIHIDADLYSAVLFALCECDSILHPGDIIIFDEFSNVFNEFKALDDWRRAYLRNYEVLYHTRWVDQVCIRISDVR